MRTKEVEREFIQHSELDERTSKFLLTIAGWDLNSPWLWWTNKKKQKFQFNGRKILTLLTQTSNKNNGINTKRSLNEAGCFPAEYLVATLDLCQQTGRWWSQYGNRGVSFIWRDTINKQSHTVCLRWWEIHSRICHSPSSLYCLPSSHWKPAFITHIPWLVLEGDLHEPSGLSTQHSEAEVLKTNSSLKVAKTLMEF